MAYLLDNLTAIVVGSVLILTLLTIQMRDRSANVNDTITHTVRVQLHEAMDIVDDDLENMWSPGEMSAETGADLSSFGWQVDTSAVGLTQRVAFVGSVQLDTSGTMASREYAAVTYDLVPNGGTVDVGGVPQPLYTLVRTADYSAFAALPTAVDTLSRSLIDFRVGFVSGVLDSDITWDGTAPAGTHSVHLSVGAARPGLENVTTDIRNVGATNAVLYSTTYSPNNI